MAAHYALRSRELHASLSREGETREFKVVVSWYEDYDASGVTTYRDLGYRVFESATDVTAELRRTAPCFMADLGLAAHQAMLWRV